jgi:hypothetical protein
MNREIACFVPMLQKICSNQKRMAGVMTRSNKYNISDKSRRTMDGIVFDSMAEMNRYAELKILERAGVIKDLALQPRFTLIEKTPRTRQHVYTADFMYLENAQVIVEDVKGAVTKDYVLRRDMFLVRYPRIAFRENRNGTIRNYECVLP